MSTASVLIMIWMILLLSSLSHIREIEANRCSDRKCRDMHIPFPFKIGKGDTCGLPGFEIECKRNASFGNGQLLPFLRSPSGDVQIVNISDNYILINSTLFTASSCKGGEEYDSKKFEIKRDGPFRISVHNTFVAVGCDSLGYFGMAKFDTSDDEGHYIVTGGCSSWCADEPSSLSNCNGDGCCHHPVPQNYTALAVGAWWNVSSLMFSDEPSCTYAAIIDKDRWSNVSGLGIKKFRREDSYMRLDWAIPNEKCIRGHDKRNTSSHCDQNADCHTREWGIVCKCRKGYKGDGYKKGTKCEDIDECSNSILNKCTSPPEGGKCENTNGSYKCSCPKGHGDGFTNGTGCKSTSYCRKGQGDGFENGVDCDSTGFQTLPLIIGVCVTLVAVLVAGAALFWIHRRRKAWLAKKNNFRHNGGEHLQSLVSSGEESTRIFSLDEIEKATNNFSENSVLGAGGYGTVYKGTLTDGLIVAIKKSKSLEVDSKEIDQFINEIVILSKINHRNIVKVLGCCLESPVPLLVYEYIPNGTVFEHLYQDRQSLQWEERLRIATETAEALSYLHSAASIPIIHRDIKSSNILLDHGCTPKVADFGVSRLLPMDRTHITTVVQGTMGYLDPEYFQTVQLTEKSDVYSFGVVLVELLTGLKPISYERIKNESNLAIYFISKMKTQDLEDILDPRLNLEDCRSVESMKRVAMLAKECLSVEGEKRPTMKEVVQELLWIRGGCRAHAWADGNAAENEEEMVALIEEDEQRSEGVQVCTTRREVSMLQSMVSSFGIEGSKDSLRRGR